MRTHPHTHTHTKSKILEHCRTSSETEKNNLLLLEAKFTPTPMTDELNIIKKQMDFVVAKGLDNFFANKNVMMMIH